MKHIINSFKKHIFPSFPSFRIGSIAQNENPETPEIFESLKTLNFACQALRHFT